MSKYDSIIQSAAQAYNVDPALIRAVIQTESSGNPNAKSSAGAVGLGQLMPATAQALGVKDPTDPNQAIPAIANLLNENLTRYGNVPDALRAYHGGTDPKNWGPLTQAYPQQVLSKIGAQQPAQPQTLPGIPVSAPASGGQSDDAIFSAFSGGQAAPAQAQGPQSDDAIFAAFSKGAAPAQTAQPAQAQAPQAAEQPGMLSSLGAGLGRGVQETVLGGQQLIGHALQSVGFNNAGQWLVNDANKGLQTGAQEVSPYQQAHPIVTGAGQLGGSIAATAPLGMLAPAAKTLGGMAAIGGVTSAATGALSPVDPNSPDFWSQKGKQIGIAGLAGGIMSPVAGVVGRMISPNTSPEVQALMQKGVTPTPGQILGGAAATTEEKLTSVPVLGDLIKNAQQRAVQDFNRATYNDALAPIGQTLPDNVPVGSAGVDYVKNQIGKVYQAIEPKASFVADQNFSNDVEAIRNQLSQAAPAALPQFDNIVKNQIASKVSGGVPFGANDIPVGGTMNGSQWGDTRSMIANLSRKQTIGNADADKWALSDALDDLNKSVNDAVGRSSPPDVLADLQKANAGWANYKQIEKAAGSVGASNKGNIFSPAQFTSAVRAGATSAQRATNSGLNADLGQAAQSVLGNKYPDSGTAGRGLLALLTSGGLGAGLATAPGSTLAGLAGIGAASLPYTRLGQRATAALLTARPQFAQPVGNAVTGLGRLIVPGSLPALLSGG